MTTIPKKKYHCRANTYIKHGNIAYLITRNFPPETVIIDVDDIEKCSVYSWSAHPYFNGIKNIKHRYIDTDGKWKSITLAHVLGFGRGWRHKNGNRYDFRKENMIKNKFFNNCDKMKVVE